MKYLFLSAAIMFGCVQINTPAQATNCVEYVKYATGLNLMGNAYQWWYSAANVLDRGYAPAPGAIMVFSRTARMHVGHVAIVRELRGSREILIDQANWHHGRVDHGVSVIDTSAANDWSSVQVEWTPKVYGGPFPITGFIYTKGAPIDAVDRGVTTRDEPQLIEASSRGDGVTIIRGSHRSHGLSGHLVLADTHHANKPVLEKASLTKPEAKHGTTATVKPAVFTKHSTSSDKSSLSIKTAKCEKHPASHTIEHAKQVSAKASAV